MYVGRKGYSTVLVATLLFAFVIVAGGVYYIQAKARMALLPRKLFVYPSINPPHNGSQSVSVDESTGVCPILEKNPGLYARFSKTRAVLCGEQTKSGRKDTTAALTQCIENALSKCAETKTYLYVERKSGYEEYLITTHDCEMFVDGWSTVPPQCGVKYDACRSLAADFPQSICHASQAKIVQPTMNIHAPQESPQNLSISPTQHLQKTEVTLE